MKLQKKYGMATCSGRHLWLLVGGGVSPRTTVVDKRVLPWLDKARGFLESMNPIAIAGPTVGTLESLLSRYHRLLETEAADLLIWRS
jgi:hypothetical protein